MATIHFHGLHADAAQRAQMAENLVNDMLATKQAGEHVHFEFTPAELDELGKNGGKAQFKIDDAKAQGSSLDVEISLGVEE